MPVISVGAGLTRPRARRLEAPSIAEALSQLPGALEEWWSPHLWHGDKRTTSGWSSSWGVAIDIDPTAPKNSAGSPDALTAKLSELPGSFAHPTPHGARVVFQYGSCCTDGAAQKRAARGAAQLVSAALVKAGLADHFKVDEPVVEDLARLFYTPRATVKGEQRTGDLIELRARPWSIDELAPGIGEAFARWNADHPLSFDSRQCPVCGHNGCFGPLPEARDRWFCWSTSHVDGVGIRAPNGYHGDALDLEAHRRGMRPVEVLRMDGYLAPRVVAPVPVVPLDQMRRGWRSNSPLTVADLVRNDERGVVGGRLEYNQMTGRHEIGRRAISDEDITRIRCNIELRFAGGISKQGEELGMKQSSADVRAGVEMVARENAYHPVAEYLNSLRWDGVERLDAVPEDLLGAERSAINSILFRRFAISAAARALEPGCKVDTVLILVGDQGKGKSSFLGILGGDWFVDTAVDIHDKDSLQVLRTAWIYEWSELEMLRRARDVSAAKAFLSSRVDTYRRSYGHYVEDVPRGCVIAGSTNQDEFLTDDTGNRRFWPLRIGEIDREAAREMRDQLWAEAVHRYRAGEQWWLTDDESALLDGVHADHVERDIWDERIWEWAEKQVVPFRAVDALEHAIQKAVGTWTDADKKRVARSLKRGGWKRETDKPRSGPRRWFR